MYWNTRADDLVVKAMIGLLERNPNLPKDRVDDVAIAATTQTGDQGLTLGRTAAHPRGPSAQRARLRDRPHVRRRDDERHDDRRRDRLRRVRRRHRRRRRAHGPPPDGRSSADPNPRFLAEKLVSADALNMGNTAERIHDRFPQLTKERADRFAMRSQQKVAAAYEAGKIQPDLIPVAIRSEAGWGLATETRACVPRRRWRASPRSRRRSARTDASPPATPPASTTAPRSRSSRAPTPRRSSASRVKMRIVSFAFAGVEPEIMGIGPIPSTEKALRKAGLTIDDIGLFELNEAFAVQVLSLLDHFGIDDDDPRVNPWGGAIAIGHPLASSGVRLMIQLARQFEEHPEVRYGLTGDVRRPRPGRQRHLGEPELHREAK